MGGNPKWESWHEIQQYESPSINECCQFSYQFSRAISVNLAKFYPLDKPQTICICIFFITNVVDPLCISIFDNGGVWVLHLLLPTFCTAWVLVF